MDSAKRFRMIRNILVSILLVNWGVAAAKIVYARWTQSASMTADGLHSFSDGASNIVGLFGIWLASRPVDESHPYGHKKFETFTAVGIALLLFLVCLNVVREGILRFLRPVVPMVTFNSFLIMGVTLGINVAVMAYETKRGKALGSDILISDAMHTRADILTSCSVIVAFIGTKLGYPLLDPLVALVIALFIGYAAIQILKESSRILMDGVAIPMEEIEKVVLSVEGVEQCHRVRSRGREDDIHIDLHVLVDQDMHIDRAHDLSKVIEQKIKGSFRGVTDVVVHLEPAEEASFGKQP